METKPLEEHRPACLDSSDENLKDRWYCYLCSMPWYNCLCSHDEED